MARGRNSSDSCIFINSLETTEKILLISQFPTPTHYTPIIRSIIQLSEALNALTFQIEKEYNFMKFANSNLLHSLNALPLPIVNGKVSSFGFFCVHFIIHKFFNCLGWESARQISLSELNAFSMCIFGIINCAILLSHHQH